jgi:hypothetical protein
MDVPDVRDGELALVVPQAAPGVRVVADQLQIADRAPALPAGRGLSGDHGQLLVDANAS